jgi:hypothetical protein
MKNIASRKSPLKSLAFFLSISSLVGISSMPATAETGETTDWQIDVLVIDTACNLPDTPATWNPDMTVNWEDGDNEVDLYNISWDYTADFDVFLDIQLGNDNCGENEVIEPLGIFELSFIPDDGSPLQMTSSYCGGVSCNADDSYYTGGSMVYGTIDASNATEEGTFSGTFRVVWVP